jgi:hypothetical protein
MLLSRSLLPVRDEMSDAFIGQLTDALAIELDAADPTSTRHAAALKVLEASTTARVAAMSDDQRMEVIDRAIDILRAQNAGWEAEAEVRRIMSVEEAAA